MADRERLCKERAEVIGLFDFAGLYRYAHWWMKEKENYAVIEEKYTEKISSKGERDIDIEWICSKPYSDYFKVEQKVKFEVRGMADVEVEMDGVKKKMQKGRVWIEIKGYLTKDPESKWDITPWYRFLRDFYNKYVIPGRVDYMEDKVVDDARDFKDDVKQFLDLMGKR